MNKLTKGTIAVGAAVLLLVGGGGTLAYWNSTANITSADIAAGQLSATAGTGTWTVQHGTGTVTTVDIATYVAVPGDKITYTTPVTVTAEGTNLKFVAKLGNGSIVGKTNAAADTALAAILNNSVTYTLSTAETGVTINNAVSPATATLDGLVGPTDTYVIDVAVTITWPFGAAGSETTDNPAKNGNVTLSGLTVLVEQIPGS